MEPDAEAFVAATKAIVARLAFSQLGNVNAMAEEEAREVVERLIRSPNLLHGVLRLMSAIIAGAAVHQADGRLGPDVDDGYRDALAADFIRSGLVTTQMIARRAGPAGPAGPPWAD